MSDLYELPERLKSIKLSLEILSYRVQYSEISRPAAIRNMVAISSMMFYYSESRRFFSYCQVPNGMVSIVCDLEHSKKLQNLVSPSSDLVTAPTIWVPIRVREGDSALVTLISGILSSNSISIFYLSTETCDYLMVREEEVSTALSILQDKLTVAICEEEDSIESDDFSSESDEEDDPRLADNENKNEAADELAKTKEYCSLQIKPVQQSFTPQLKPVQQDSNLAIEEPSALDISLHDSASSSSTNVTSVERQKHGYSYSSSTSGSASGKDFLGDVKSPSSISGTQSANGSQGTADSQFHHSFVLRLVQRTLYMMHYMTRSSESLVVKRLLYCIFIHDSVADFYKMQRSSNASSANAQNEEGGPATELSASNCKSRFFCFSDVDGAVTVVLDRDQFEIVAFGEDSALLHQEIEVVKGKNKTKMALGFTYETQELNGFNEELIRTMKSRKSVLKRHRLLSVSDDPETINAAVRCQNLILSEANEYVSTYSQVLGQINQHGKNEGGDRDNANASDSLFISPESSSEAKNNHLSSDGAKYQIEWKCPSESNGHQHIKPIVYSPFPQISRLIFAPCSILFHDLNPISIEARSKKLEFDWNAIANTIKASETIIDSWLANVARQQSSKSIEALKLGNGADCWTDKVMDTWMGRTWRCFQLDGDWGFEETGVVYSLSRPITEAGICPLYISTFRTDYILVPEPQAQSAISLLMDRFPVYPI